jgi:amphi-Trp domain-containing protein
VPHGVEDDLGIFAITASVLASRSTINATLGAARHLIRSMRLVGCRLGSRVLPVTITRRLEMELELKEKTTMSREEAAARLHSIAEELSSGNDIVMERAPMRFVAKVPDEVALKLEFEVEDDEAEFEIELTWQSTR